VKASYDIEDMIGDVVLRIWRQRLKYNPKRARESTWVTMTARGECLNILYKSQRLKYQACTTVELTADLERTVPGNSTQRTAIAKDAVERVIEFSSDAVLNFLQQLFSGTVTQVPTYVVEELKSTCKRCGASLEDFQLVYRLVTG
jgi:DNA-directed RNA polymerase specialized sigma24 family protein